MRKPIQSVEGQVRLVVGSLVLASVVLAYTVGLPWLFMTTFIGFALVVAGSTGVCPMEFFVGRCPWNQASREASRTPLPR